MQNANTNSLVEDLEIIKSGNLSIQASPVSVNSFFEDSIWDFNDPRKPRNLSGYASKRRIIWSDYYDKLPNNIIYSLKVLAFFYARYPILYSGKKIPASENKPITFCPRIKTLLEFIVLVYRNSLVEIDALESGKRINSKIETIFDITIEDIQKAASGFNPVYKNPIKQALSFSLLPIVTKYLEKSKNYEKCKSFAWNKNDIKNLKFNATNYDKKQNSSKEYSDQPISDQLLNMLVKRATSDVLLFLTSMDLKAESLKYSRDNKDAAINNSLISKIPNFKKAFTAYLNIRMHDYDTSRLKGFKTNNSVTLRKNFKLENNLTVGDFKLIIERIWAAARYLFLQFTGVRYSETTFFKVGCLKKVHNIKVVVGTVIKNRSTNLATNNEYWVACPIVCDSIKVLEYMANYTKNDHLFGCNRLALKENNRPLSNYGLNNSLTSYLYWVDTERKFSVEATDGGKREAYLHVLPENRLSIHRLRHTLALNMSRIGLGIPYVSLHFKHAYEAHKKFQTVSNVSLGYGNTADDIFKNATTIAIVNREIVNSIYHPDSPIAGLNAEDFKKRRENYFTGMMAAGWTFDEIMEHLYNKGVPFADVGLGYCGGKRAIEKEDGTKELPPCLGQLKCNPVQCKNAIISDTKIPIWKKMYKENSARLNNPYLVHAKKEMQAHVNEAKEVLTSLGVKIEEI